MAENQAVRRNLGNHPTEILNLQVQGKATEVNLEVLRNSGNHPTEISNLQVQEKATAVNQRADSQESKEPRKKLLAVADQAKADFRKNSKPD